MKPTMLLWGVNPYLAVGATVALTGIMLVKTLNNMDNEKTTSRPSTSSGSSSNRTFKLNKYRARECPICLQELNSSGYTAPCGHTFHHECIKMHYRSYRGRGTPRCPVCRQQDHDYHDYEDEHSRWYENNYF